MGTGIFAVLAGIAVLLAIAVGVALLVKAWRQHRQRRGLVLTIGVVTDVRVWTPHHPVGEARLPLQFPTVRFTTPDEQVDEAEVRQAFSWERHQPGRQVAIRYDPADPDQVWPASGAGPVMYGCIGGIFLMVGLSLTPVVLLFALVARN